MQDRTAEPTSLNFKNAYAADTYQRADFDYTYAQSAPLTWKLDPKTRTYSYYGENNPVVFSALPKNACLAKEFNKKLIAK